VITATGMSTLEKEIIWWYYK